MIFMKGLNIVVAAIGVFLMLQVMDFARFLSQAELAVADEFTRIKVARQIR